MKIGSAIKGLRLKEGCSQKDLSIKSGLSERTIQRIEKNEVSPNPHTLKVLGEIFNENFYQFGNKNQPVNNKKKMSKIFILWNWMINFKINVLKMFLKKIK
tara:strand:+ start:980 stop:1282 length:303 start_codon:yes stop_codon:yes gene_type:complete